MKEFRYRYYVLESILVSSITEGNPRLPTIEEFVLSEVINGALAFVGGDAGEETYAKYRGDNRYENKISDYFKKEMAKAPRHLCPKINDAIYKMVEIHWVFCPPFDNYPNCDLYNFLKILPTPLQSTYSPSFEMVNKVQKNLLPSFTEPERRDILGIGKAMRRFVDEDLNYIKKTYWW